ncbi:MAG: glutamate synthase subunit alpha, partial [Oscillochloris sp.]|nr:glutamate synthase subunit alpha [Oscillochloris sp.]
TWERAQPFRMLSHNGEINTIQGNANWMRAREAALGLPEDFLPGCPDTSALLTPVLDTTGSDSAQLDNALELLVTAGRDIRHAMMMLVPEAWENIPDLSPSLRAFYQYHACLMEPWDGPAALTFSDGRVVGTTLDRNGLRPARYVVTSDGLVISGSEVGAVKIDDARVVHKGKLGPGQMIAVDTVTGQIYTDEDIKASLAARQPYDLWLSQNMRNLPAVDDTLHSAIEDLAAQQMAFGYTTEELNVVVRPMLSSGHEPIGSMGDDTPAAVLSQLELGRPLFQFFKQRFAEVTNPPIDSLREELVMSLSVAVGMRHNILAETPSHAHLIQLTSPILRDAQIAALRTVDDPQLRVVTISALMPVAECTLAEAVARLCQDAETAVRNDAAIVIVSDKGVDAKHAPIPSLLAVAAVHHHLIRTGLRSRISLLSETGELREVHHLACLTGYGAEAINPYLALASVRQIALERDALKERATRGAGPVQIDPLDPRSLGLADEAEQHFIHALEKGLLKTMSKMGIAALDSYCGAQIFEAVGISKELVDQCFVSTPTRIGGISFAKLEEDVLARHVRAFPVEEEEKESSLPHPGFYKFKRGGETHTFSPPVVNALHRAAQSAQALESDNTSPTPSTEGYGNYRRYADLVNGRELTEPRDLLDFVPAGPAVPLDEVEPIEAIAARFSTAAMSHGSTSSESHVTLAIAMNRLGGMSNSGEGGEDAERFKDERNSRIKQVASGRFGVTPAYLASAAELQIKMAQGAKPGEGGQLPGHKVNEEIAKIRHTVPGVALISPPPHHDIYSIEDLAQLIYDLKQVNPNAHVSVKLV